MNSAEFYSLIDDARDGLDAPDPSVDPEELRAVLDKLGDEQVGEFGEEFYRQLIRLNQWDIWGAGYVIAGGMGDDSFRYFRSWLIGKGSDAVEQALADPDGLGPFIDTAEVDNELLEYVASEVLENRGMSYDPRDVVDGAASDEPDGDPFDEDTVNDNYPNLAALHR
jgi:hypothetical protein